MASNITKRLDRIEKLAQALLSQSEGPIYCREGQEPKDIDPERLVVIRREYVKPPERPDLTLPPLSETAGNLFGADARKPLRDFHRPLECTLRQGPSAAGIAPVVAGEWSVMDI